MTFPFLTGLYCRSRCRSRFYGTALQRESGFGASQSIANWCPTTRADFPPSRRWRLRLLSVDESFFAESSGNRKEPKLLTGDETARIFVEEALQPHEGKILKLGDAYEFYVNFCQGKSLPVIHKNEFKKPTVLAVRNTFNLGFRNDLKLDGKYAHGWKGLEVTAGASQTVLAE